MKSFILGLVLLCMPTTLTVPESPLILTGEGVKVAVLDNGVDTTAVALAPAGGFNTFTRSTAKSAWNDIPDACGGHSTHVFGIVRQVAPKAQIYAVDVTYNDPTTCATFASNLITGIDWAVQNKMDVIVISKWVPWRIELETAIRNAISAGVVVVAAAGNGGAITVPANIAGVIAVGSVGPTGLISSFSSRGPQLLVMAPGENILSNVPINRLERKSGTSMSAPYVAGIVSQLIQAHPTATPAQISAALCKGAEDIMPLGRDNFSGCGKVNLTQSLTNFYSP